MQLYAIAFVVLWLWRYTRTLVHILSAWTFKPVRPARVPKFGASDVTVVLPTLGEDDHNFRRCLLSINGCNPKAVVVVTPKPGIVRQVCTELGLSHFEVLKAPKANKRLQMIQGIEHVNTPISVFTDDDVFWPKPFLHYLLAAFDDPSVGAVGPTITLERPENPNVWEILGAEYLERWHFGVKATANIDGGIQCLSGRTCAVRSAIVQEDAFKDEFAHEKWFFGIQLSKADDDNFVTRWLVNHGWKIAIQSTPEADMSTIVESSPAYIGQCIRWHRTTWRSNITSMFVDRRIWKDQPWSSYALHLSTFNPPAFMMEAILVYLLFHAYDNGQPYPIFPASRMGAFALLYVWLFFAKIVKMLPHFYKYPTDLKFFPALVAFGYFHGLIKIYTLLTIHKTTWDGSRMSLTMTSLADAASSVATTAKESGESVLRRSGYDGDVKRIQSSTDLKRLVMRSDSSG
ncbi:MAG: hypothetical protein L6R39_004837 [Caloplaca ligustica]|nr:MAG: hypothetical protein L6R39_004837 [Caloplaca ligustica]